LTLRLNGNDCEGFQYTKVLKHTLVMYERFVFFCK
jgi:hypothetical protein